jgi:hypothetical protein
LRLAHVEDMFAQIFAENLDGVDGVEARVVSAIALNGMRGALAS